MSRPPKDKTLDIELFADAAAQRLKKTLMQSLPLPQLNIIADPNTSLIWLEDTITSFCSIHRVEHINLLPGSLAAGVIAQTLVAHNIGVTLLGDSSLELPEPLTLDATAALESAYTQSIASLEHQLEKPFNPALPTLLFPGSPSPLSFEDDIESLFFDVDADKPTATFIKTHPNADLWLTLPHNFIGEVSIERKPTRLIKHLSA